MINLIKNKNRALCEGKTFKAFTNNALFKCFLAIFVLGIVLIPTSVKAATYEDITNGVKYTYSLHNNNTEITITKATIPTNVTELIIPDTIDNKPVTYLGSSAFYNCDTLIKVTIPKEVVTIGTTYYSGNGTFANCDNLNNVVFEENSNLKTIGYYTFNYCKLLENIILPENIERICQSAFSSSGITNIIFTGESNLSRIEDSAFSNCNRLTTVTFEGESSVANENIAPLIGNYAFQSCTSLTEIRIPSKIQTIGTQAFNSCTKLEKVEFGDNSQLKSIGDNSFGTCSALTEIKIPARVETIGNSAFYSCSILTSLTFDEESNLKTIGNSAFSGCKLNKITIPKTTISIGNSAFSSCRYAKELEFEDGSVLESIGTSAFYGCTELLTISELPETIKTIGDKAFQNCGKINNITLPKSLENIGSAVFGACTSLSNLEVNEENLNFISENNVVYTNDKTEIIIYPAGKADNSYTVPNEVTTIRDGAFYGNISIVNIVFEEEGNNITYIGKEAFYNCTFLNNIKIPENLEIINSNTFYNCDALTMIEIPEKITSIGAYALSNCNSLENVIFIGESNLEIIETYAFSGSAVIEIIIPRTVTEIRSRAFNSCSKLNKVLFAENSELNFIGNYAFSNCSKLKEIKLPSKLKTIETYAFESCRELIEINIPYGVETIYSRTFYWCYNLEKVTFEKDSEEISNLITIGDSAFYDCNIKELEIPANVATIGSLAFYYNGELTSVIFEDNSSLTSVYEDTFRGCSSLNNITIENETENGKYKIIDGALYDTANKKIVLYPQNKTDITEYTVPDGTVRIGDYAFNNGALLKINIPSSVTYIGTSSFNGKNKNLVIECRQNSRAFEYAKYYGINYIVSQFEAVISYDNTELTKEPITAIITLNEKLSDETKIKLEGENWVYNEELLKLEKVYEKNTSGVETINIVDWLGNQLNVYVSITNIDNEIPTLNIVYTPTELTRESVNVVIVANEAISKEVAIIENGEIARTEEWEHLIQTTPFMLTCDFDENTNMNIKVKDLAGNYSEVTPIVITNIKTEIATPEITYTPVKEGITNQNVIAKVSFENTSEEQIEFINSEEEITKEGLNAKYEFKENGRYTIYYKDIAENQENITLEVDWIDKTSPKIEGVEDGKTYTRKVEIKVVDENLSEVTIVKDNDTTINYEEGMEIEAIGQYTITTIDAATNSSEVSFEIAKEIINVESISLNTNNVEMKPEESISLEATITPANATNKNIIWTSTNPEVATVSNGVVISKNVGETTILAKTEDGEKTVYCQVKVEKEVDLQGPTITEIKITPETWTNGNVEVEIIAEDENGLAEVPYSINGKTWTNEKLEISENGKYEVYVKDTSGNVTKQEIEISNIDKTSPKIEGVTNGKTYTKKLQIDISDENSFEVKIIKNNTDEIEYVAEMQISGVGDYKITAIDIANNTTEIEFKIVNEIINVNSISIDNQNATLNVEDNIIIETTIFPSNATNKNIIWTSTNPEIAIVNNGVVIAKQQGTTKIVATTEDGAKTDYCIVNVVKDEKGPTIKELKTTPTTWTNGNVEIEIIAEDENGLADIPYSLDTTTWTKKNLIVTQNGKYEVYVKDTFGNVTIQEVEISNIDKTSPELKIEVVNNDKVTKTKEVTITAEDTLSGLNEQNEYKYCVTDSKELQNEEWLDYELNHTFEIGEKTGEYYLHVKGILDKAGNETKIEPIKITLDNTAPKVLINNEKPKTEYKIAKITVEEKVYEIVVMKDGQEIEYKENETLKEIGNYEIIVKDIAGNESKVKFEISEFITNEKYTTHEEEGIWYIGNISPETSKEKFIENLDTNIEGIEVKTKEQAELLDGKYVGTGMTTTIQGIEYILIVKGDTTGDGKANGQDALAMLFHREGKLLLEGESLKAADLNEDGKINGIDALLLLLHRERQEGYIL